MNELSLFTGAGGGVLGTHHLLGFKSIGYVEWEPYCQKILQARIADGHLDAAPIFGDIRKFVSEGYADAYQGMVDVVTAGFPCQPFSIAGKQAAAADPRNMWPATADVLRIVRPKYALLENVTGLLNTGYCESIFGDLASMGFDAKWGVFSAAEEGAPHVRERLFILCTDTKRQLADSDTLGRSHSQFEINSAEAGFHAQRHLAASRQDVADAKRIGQSQSRTSWHAFDPAEDVDRETDQSFHERVGHIWGIESKLGRVANGVAHRVDRLKATGNGQVSSVAARAWQVLSERT
jgi:DNA (cytosine-5)-methyltransferase 1